MAESIASFFSYNDFERSGYFVACFNKLASLLNFTTTLEESKENMETALRTVGLDVLEMEVVFKNWNTEDAKNSDFSRDFPYEYLLKSKTKSLLIWLSLQYDQLYVEFLYDQADMDLEQWVISTNHRLRGKFGMNRTPVFYVLSRNGGRFFTEEVRTEGFESDIEKMYNDDFFEINEIIEESLTIDKAGLILLHGAPGTGKTSYIKNLIKKHEKRSFIFIQNEFINELLHPDFISFLLNHQNSILIIEDAEKVLMSREQASESSVVSTILQLTDGLFSDYLNIKIICTFNTSLDKVDKALLRKGRMIAYYEFRPLNTEKANKLLIGMDHGPTDVDLTLADIFNYRNRSFSPAEKGKIGFRK